MSDLKAAQNIPLAVSLRHVNKRYEFHGNRRRAFLRYLFNSPLRETRFHEALHDLSLDVPKGQILGVIGRNGSGKSTLLQIMAGLLRPTAGEVTINQRPTTLFDLTSGFSPDFTGRDNIFLLGSILGFTMAETRARLDEIIEFAEIGDFIDKPVRSYSKGMLLRLSFSINTTLHSGFLLIDEALAVGDMFFRQKCYERLRRLCDENATIVMVSHSLIDIEELCDRAIFLERGSVKCDGPPQEAVHAFMLSDQKLAAASNEIKLNVKGRRKENGTLELVEATILNESHQKASIFAQGERARFSFHIKARRDVHHVMAVLAIRNSRNLLVHGKSNLQCGLNPIDWLASGDEIEYHFDVNLSLEPGRYSYEFTASTMDEDTWHSYSTLPWTQFEERLHRDFVLMPAGFFEVSGAHSPTLTHYGMADLPVQVSQSVQRAQSGGAMQKIDASKNQS